MNKFKNITSSSLIKTGTGVVSQVIVNSHTAGTIKLWDNTSAAGTVIINTYTFPSGSSFLELEDIAFTTGLYATIGGTADVTIVYN